MSTNIVSFVEETCFSGDTFRSVRREIVFTVLGFGNNLGRAVKHDFSADNGIWYDYEDDYLIQILEKEIPDIDWGYFVFHKKMDHSSIEIICPEKDRVIGSIHVRRATNPNLSGENKGANIVSLNEWKETRSVREASEGCSQSEG